MPLKPKFQWILLPGYMIDDAEKESKVLNEDSSIPGITKEGVVERRFYGYDVKEDIAREAKEALDKYHNTEVERNAIAKAAELENYAKITAYIKKQEEAAFNGQHIEYNLDEILKIKGEE